MSAQSYPLTWPIRLPRTKARSESRFRKPVRTGYGNRRHSIAEGRDKLFAELERLGAKKAILSTNLRLRLDGLPHSNQPNPEDPGVAIYFELKGKQIVLPCDRWQHVECNIWAIACHIETLRQQDRWGVGSVEQAFAGYAALPEKTTENPWEILGIPELASEPIIMDAYRRKAKEAHPDKGGSTEQFRAICEAKDIALATIHAQKAA